MKNEKPLTASEQVALWADKLRDLSATGLCYASTIYDRERYETLQTMAMEMMALATTQSLDTLEPLRATFFSRPSPVVVGTAAVIDSEGMLLLMRRTDNGLWGMPGGGIEVGETAAAAAVRETYEETGVRCEPTALIGIYDSRLWDVDRTHHYCKFTFLCSPTGEAVSPDLICSYRGSCLAHLRGNLIEKVRTFS
jgi:ADP-ribose pyrophosphatase YjhB (NUDIX family)